MKLFGLGKDARQKLEGRWVLDPSDTDAVAAFGKASAEFANGRLVYEVEEDGKLQIMLMTYRVEGQTLITDQPSHPRPERTRYSLGGDTLTLEFGGLTGRFIRA